MEPTRTVEDLDGGTFEVMAMPPIPANDEAMDEHATEWPPVELGGEG